MSPLYRCLFAFLFLLGLAAAAQAADEDEAAITPPRLSYVDGEISFWRPGAEDWLTARLNTPVAVGDEIYAGDGANFELQVGPRGFVRADERSQVALVNQDPDFIQFRVTTGRVSLDLRELDPGTTIEVATPHAVFTIDHEGYYRLDIDGDTRFVTRRGGRATMTPAGGRAMSILPSEEIVVRGDASGQAETYVAPELDHWDRWNYSRSDDLLDAASARYLPAGVYGADELDRHGNWRVVPEYGPIWIPDGMARGWAPYSTGSWVWDPYYEWTWIDDAPWGWAPYHYGRWISIDGLWAWAPGPVGLRRPHYSPALVAFFWAGDDISVRISLGTPGVYWVSLSWGEPVIPWWGRHGFRGKPWWGGWHGPRVVNNIVIKDKTVVNVTNIVYRNSRLERAVAYAPRDRFGKRHEPVVRPEPIDIRQMTRVHGALPVRPGPESVAFGARKGIRPPPEVTTRAVVATRPPHQSRLPWRAGQPAVKEAPKPGVRVVPTPSREDTGMRRPDFGQQGVEERPRPPQPARYREMRQPQAVPQGAGADRKEVEPPMRTERIRQEPAREMPQTRETRQTREPREAVPAQEPWARERPNEERRSLPGNPANRMYRRNDKDDEGGRAGGWSERR